MLWYAEVILSQNRTIIWEGGTAVHTSIKAICFPLQIFSRLCVPVPPQALGKMMFIVGKKGEILGGSERKRPVFDSS